MSIDIAVKGLVDEFNDYFKGDAEITINGDRLEITMNGATLVISMLPKIVGAQARDSS